MLTVFHKNYWAVSMEPQSTTILVETSLAEYWSGNPKAIEKLFSASQRRLLAIARRMSADFPRLAASIETDDLTQMASLRMLRALDDEKVVGRVLKAADFFRLATCQMRRELIDLCRKYGHTAEPFRGKRGNDSGIGGAEPSDNRHVSYPSLEVWERFHKASGQLPSPQKETFEYIYYQELSYADAADLLPETPSERTVRRWFRTALQMIQDHCGGELPAI